VYRKESQLAIPLAIYFKNFSVINVNGGVKEMATDNVFVDYELILQFLYQPKPVALTGLLRT